MANIFFESYLPHISSHSSKHYRKVKVVPESHQLVLSSPKEKPMWSVENKNILATENGKNHSGVNKPNNPDKIPSKAIAPVMGSMGSHWSPKKKPEESQHKKRVLRAPSSFFVKDFSFVMRNFFPFWY